MSAFANCGRAVTHARGSYVPGTDFMHRSNSRHYSITSSALRDTAPRCGYCIASPCNARSRPSRSVFSVTRRPTNILTTVRMIKLATAS